ncbi:MAG: lysophospholipid acyltransferase family protein [Pseudomonadales bacterium]|nr:lysophospholipid acyltransferase family protein [Pseudomonadales bacterium]
MFKQALASGALALIALLPLAAVRRLASGLAQLSAWLQNDIYRITHTNIKLIQPHLDANAQAELARDALRSTLCTSLEMPLIWRRNNRWLQQKITEVVGEQHLLDVLGAGKGLIVICPHVGNWEVFGRYLPRYAPTTNLYQKPKYDALDALVKRGREQSGARLVPTNQRGIAQLLKALQRGEIIGMLPDQVPKNDAGIYAPFFDVPALSMTLVHRLIQRTGCKAVLGYALRQRDGFAIYFKPALDDIYSADQQRSVTALNAMVEMSTAEDIAQYQWAYKRFKLLPDGQRPYQHSTVDEPPGG